MSTEFESSPYFKSEVWAARDLLIRRNLTTALEAWNEVLAISCPSNAAILALESAAAGLSAAAAELQFMRSSR